MTQAKTSIKCQFPDAFTCDQEGNYLEIQLVDENDNALAGILVKAENQATRDAFIPPENLYATTDNNGIVRFDDIHPLDINIFVEEQRLVEEMSLRPLRLGREEMDSAVKERTTKNDYVYHYAKIGELCKRMPVIQDWYDEKPPAFHFPNNSFEGIRVPENQLNRRHVIEVCPFRAWILKLNHIDKYSLINAYNLGMMADLAYAKQDAVNGFFNYQCQDLSKIPMVQEYPSFYHAIVIDVPFDERYNRSVFIDTATGDNPEADTQLFFVYSKKQVIVAWRGTEPDKLQDIITDLTFRPVPCYELVTRGMVHKGFYEAFDMARNKFFFEFEDFFDKLSGRDLFICGHSLGGALALIHAVQLSSFMPVVYTYGMPRTFTFLAISHFPEITHFRHVNDADTVTSIPPQADLDNKLYEIYGPPGIVLGFFGSFWGMLPQTILGAEIGDPYWHHGNIVAFFKAEQSLMKKRNQPILWIGGGGVDSPTREISYKLVYKTKLYLVPSLNNDFASKAEEDHKTFFQRLDQRSLDAFFPRNTNPALDSLITNPGDHSMARKYMPFINNQLIELVAKGKNLKRVRDRSQFIKQMSNVISSEQGDNKEIDRNNLFLQLQNLLSSALDEKEENIIIKNALLRFSKVSEEEIEEMD